MGNVPAEACRVTANPPAAANAAVSHQVQEHPYCVFTSAEEHTFSVGVWLRDSKPQLDHTSAPALLPENSLQMWDAHRPVS